MAPLRSRVPRRRRASERFVFASSCSMYGASGSNDLLDETAPLRPLTPYAESKVRSEEALKELADGDFSPVYMRNATAYGVSPRLRLDIVLNNLAAWAHTTGKIRLLSDGSAWRPLVHIRDIARATVALLDAPRDLVHDEAFNIGSDEQNVRIRDLAETLQRAPRLRRRDEWRRDTGSTELSSRLLEAARCAPGVPLRVERRQGRDRSSRRRTRRSGLRTRTSSRPAATCGSRSSNDFSRTTCSTATCAGADRQRRARVS